MLERVFRASEHGFSAVAFHKHCDDIEDTLTLVRTEHGRTIGGYSHYKWNAVTSDYVHDEERQQIYSRHRSERGLGLRLRSGESSLLCQSTEPL
jgi:hypothetical protein